MIFRSEAEIKAVLAELRAVERVEDEASRKMRETLYSNLMTKINVVEKLEDNDETEWEN